MVTEEHVAGALDGSVDPEELTTLLAQENQALLATVEQLKAENAELRRDAERYRWLRKCSHFDMPQHRIYCGAYGPALDEDIDQAMTKEQQA